MSQLRKGNKSTFVVVGNDKTNIKREASTSHEED